MADSFDGARAEMGPSLAGTSMARRVITAIVITYLLAVLQTTLGHQIAILGVAPDLLFLWTVAVGLLSGSTAGALVGFGSGLLQGGLTQAWVGAFAMSKTISGFSAGWLATKLLREHWAVPSLCAALLTLVNDGIFLLISGAGGGGQPGRTLALRVLYHGALAPIAFALTAQGRRVLLGRREELA
jgi:rod shape-determining protein MreD